MPVWVKVCVVLFVVFSCLLTYAMMSVSSKCSRLEEQEELNTYLNNQENN